MARTRSRKARLTAGRNGACRRCGRALRDPDSVARGYGPVCWAKVRAEAAGQQALTEGPEVLVQENDWGVPWPPAPLLHIPYHSPTGFEWGYGGSGPADLALAILAHYLGEQEAVRRCLERGDRDEENKPLSLRLHQDFKWAIVARLPREGWRLTGAEIAAWLREQGIEAPERAVVYEGRRGGWAA